MTRLLLISLLIALVGCDQAGLSQAENPAAIEARGKARYAAFRDCMELAAKMPRLSDDKVGEVVRALWRTT